MRNLRDSWDGAAWGSSGLGFEVQAWLWRCCDIKLFNVFAGRFIKICASQGPCSVSQGGWVEIRRSWYCKQKVDATLCELNVCYATDHLENTRKNKHCIMGHVILQLLIFLPQFWSPNGSLSMHSFVTCTDLTLHFDGWSNARLWG